MSTTSIPGKITLASIQQEIEEQCNPFVQEVMVQVRESALSGSTSIPTLCADNGWSSFVDNPFQLQCVAGLLQREGLTVKKIRNNGYNVSWESAFALAFVVDS